MYKKKDAFTLTELLVSVAIIGVIAVLSIPPLLSDIHTKVYINMIKNMSITLEQLAADQMLNKRSHNLFDTDFGNPQELLSTRHFSIVNSSEEGLLNQTYKNFSNEDANVELGGYSVLLKNGVVITYTTNGNENNQANAGTFVMDANGNNGPNVVGKDLFVFNINPQGKLVSGVEDNGIDACRGGNPRSCFGYLTNNGWQYPN